MRAAPPAGPTVAAALTRATSLLSLTGVRDPALDAELLLRHVTGWDRARLVVEARAELPPGVLQAFLALVAERARRRPLQHLTGVQAFWRHEFVVTPDVLSPRPETEHLVEVVLGLLRGRERPRVADVGTGTGCIALSLAAERPDARVSAVDLSPAALAVAVANARRLGLAGRVGLLRGDLLAAYRPASLDLVASNPPYVEAADLPGLEPEVRDHEPRLALVPPEGPRGLYERLVGQAAERLRPGGALAVEVGAGQAAFVAESFRSQAFGGVEVTPDLAGIPRVVSGILAR